MHTEELETSFLRGVVAEIPSVLHFGSPALLVRAEVGSAVLHPLTPVHANACAASPSRGTPAACSDVTARPFKTPLGVICSGSVFFFLRSTLCPLRVVMTEARI